MTDAPAPFDRHFRILRRDRAARTMQEADFLLERVLEALLDRLGDVKRDFRRIAVVGAWDGRFAQALQEHYAPELLLQSDAAPSMAALAEKTAPEARTQIADEETLALAPDSFDLIVSPLVLHTVNDLPGALIRMRHALVPDGLLMAALPCGDTLAPLRTAMAEAELAVLGGVSPRVIPMAQLRDLGALLQRAGLALPVADRDRFTVRYGDPMRLLRDLCVMGESNAMTERLRGPVPRAVIAQAMAALAARAEPDGKIPIPVEIAWLHGWAPAESQPKALRPGSATHRLADFLGTDEHVVKD